MKSIGVTQLETYNNYKKNMAMVVGVNSKE